MGRGEEHGGDMAQLLHVDWSGAGDLRNGSEAERERKVVGESAKAHNVKIVARKIHL
jgi:hypothetical protein